MSNDNRGALLQSDAAFDGRPQRNRQVVNDLRGYIAELAAKAIDHDALTQAVTTEDKERIRALLRSFGTLDRDMAYSGSGRAGYSEPPSGGVQAGTRSQPLDLHKILDATWEFRATSAKAGIRRRR
jgi:monoamine oxidase